MENSIMLQAKQIINSSGRGDVSQFQTTIQHNYNLAIAHYDMYVQQIIQLNWSKIIQIDNNILNQLVNALSVVSKQWIQDSLILEQNAYQSSWTTMVTVIESLNLETTPEMLIALSSKAEWSTQKGIVFEEYVKQRLPHIMQFIELNTKNKLNQTVDDNIKSLLQPLITDIFHTGNQRSQSFLRSGERFIRADLGSIKNMRNSELQVEFNLSSFNNIPTLENELFQQNNLANLIDMSGFGYSLKSFPYGAGFIQDQHMMQVSGLQADLNNMFSSSTNKTWNINYAYYAMLARISELLLNLFGPINIGFFFSDSFQWTSTVLSQNVALMHIYGKLGKNGMKSQEIRKPHIYSSNLYLSSAIIHQQIKNLQIKWGLKASKHSKQLYYQLKGKIF